MIRKAKCILEMGSGVKFAFCTPECPAYRHKDNCLYLDSLAFINKNESLQGTQIGEKKSIDDIIVENYHFIKKYCEKLAKNQHVAEDICQEVLKKVFENKHRIKPDQPIIPWLLKAARNALIDYYRKEKLRTVESIDASEQGALDRSFERCETMELASLLALGTLTSQQRKALELVYVEGMSYLEAAEAMGLSYKGFYSLLKRAQEKLKKEVSDLI